MTALRTVREAPVSLNQRDQLRSIRTFGPAATGYDAAYVYALPRADVEALGVAVADLFTRRDALRSRILVRPDGDRQSVTEPAPPFALERRPATWQQLEAELAAATWGTAEVEEGRPLCRARLVLVDGTPHLVLQLHHLAYDGWSMGLLWRDLAELYSSRVADRPAGLPAAPSYLEMSEHQLADWATVRDGALEHWAHLRDYRLAPWDELGLGRPAWTTSSTSAALDPSTARAARALARRVGVSPFTVLSVASARAVARVRSVDDILIGSDHANRERRDLREVVGHVVTTRPVLMTGVRTGSLGAATERAAVTMAQDRPFRGLCFEEVHAELSAGEMLKVNLYQGDGPESAELVLPGTGVVRRPVTRPRTHWRSFGLFWSIVGDDVQLTARWRDDRVAPATARRVVAETLDELASSS